MEQQKEAFYKLGLDNELIDQFSKSLVDLSQNRLLSSLLQKLYIRRVFLFISSFIEVQTKTLKKSQKDLVLRILEC